MLSINHKINAGDLADKLSRMWDLSGEKVLSIAGSQTADSSAPVFTVAGRYTSQGWTEWTQGFQFGWAILQFDATDDEQFLEIGRTATIEKMAPHVTHFGVHDHGFN
ncbi:MAG: glycosyl hydrolase, partial [Planctomycetota bacterium]|nr:glycosyl hydrolase [Planctomycetota bacterium]